jgi:hypothetical protein
MEKSLEFIGHKFLIIINAHMANNAIKLSFNHGKKIYKASKRIRFHVHEIDPYCTREIIHDG